MEWKPMDSAPKDGTAILLFDGFGIMHARYVEPCTLDIFMTICDDGEGEAEWREYDQEQRNDPSMIYDEWAVYELGGDDNIIECYPTMWAKPEAPKLS